MEERDHFQNYGDVWGSYLCGGGGVDVIADPVVLHFLLRRCDLTEDYPPRIARRIYNGVLFIPNMQFVNSTCIIFRVYRNVRFRSQRISCITDFAMKLSSVRVCGLGVVRNFVK